MKKFLPFFLLDVVLVATFVLIGTRNHDTNTGAGGVFSVAAPFLIGLTAGWLVTQAWKTPTEVKTGVQIWVGFRRNSFQNPSLFTPKTPRKKIRSW